MKKLYVMLFISSAVLFQFCASKKKVGAPVAKVPAKITYLANVQGIISTSCAPCHIPPGGNKEPLNTYLTAKAHIDEIILRIQRAPTERGFMPQRHAKLPDSLITAFVKWKADGLLEK